ncbi:MAG TPA: rod shape-determining protein MreD, partial [Candidatus Angelobacter sp.]|nr:rod shape-determining protein MreD [Candidatus Angelobacter sp.]
SRFLMTFAFCVIHRVLYMVIDRGLVGANEPWYWGHTLLSALANALAAVVLFTALDKFKIRP